jgi:hypothetical protein
LNQPEELNLEINSRFRKTAGRKHTDPHAAQPRTLAGRIKVSGTWHIPSSEGTRLLYGGTKDAIPCHFNQNSINYLQPILHVSRPPTFLRFFLAFYAQSETMATSRPQEKTR